MDWLLRVRRNLVVIVDVMGIVGLLGLLVLLVLVVFAVDLESRKPRWDRGLCGHPRKLVPRPAPERKKKNHEG